MRIIAFCFLCFLSSISNAANIFFTTSGNANAACVAAATAKNGGNYATCSGPVYCTTGFNGWARAGSLPDKYCYPTSGSSCPTNQTAGSGGLCSCVSPNVLNSGVCQTPQEQCVDAVNPLQCQCAASGGNWLGLGGGAGECLNGPADECTASSTDYQGTINGEPVCSGAENCVPTETYGLVNGVATCIPADYGPPDCDFETVAVAEGTNGDGGFSCASPDNQPGEPAAPDADGDGTPDASDPDANDADGDATPDSQEGNDHDGDGVPNSEDPQFQDQYGTGAAAEATRDNGSKIDQTNTALNDLNQQIQNQNLTLGNMKQSLSGIDDNSAELKDYVTEESTATVGLLDGVRTAAASNQVISTAWQTHPTIASFSRIPTLAVNNACPVFVVPATAYWSAIPINIICEVINDQRAVLSLLFIGLWTLAAAMLFMRA